MKERTLLGKPYTKKERNISLNSYDRNVAIFLTVLFFYFKKNYDLEILIEMNVRRVCLIRTKSESGFS